MRRSTKLSVAAAMGIASIRSALGATPIPVIHQDFSYAPASHAFDNVGVFPSNVVGRPGQWMKSGHDDTVVNQFREQPNDQDWRPTVISSGPGSGSIQTGIDAFVGLPGHSGLPVAEYFASRLQTGNQTNKLGVYNMDALVKFTLADGTPRPAVTGDKIVGSFLYYPCRGSNFGWGFTDSLSGLHAYQAGLPKYISNGSSPVMMPSGFTDIEAQATLDDPTAPSARLPMPENVTGYIMMTGGYNSDYTHAVVDLTTGNDFSNPVPDGFVDQGNAKPHVEGTSIANRPKVSPAEAPGVAHIKFEYTVGNTVYDLFQVDNDGPLGPLGYVNVIQRATNTPNPLGPMPVGKIKTSIEGMFITGANSRISEIFYDDFFIDIIPAAVQIPGDANHDGAVNTADFNELAAHFNETTTLVWANGDVTADFNADGKINALDFNTIAANFGATPAAVLAAAVPEPSALGVLGLGALGVLRRRRF
jgi:hypothetical protein